MGLSVADILASTQVLVLSRRPEEERAILSLLEPMRGRLGGLVCVECPWMPRAPRLFAGSSLRVYEVIERELGVLLRATNVGVWDSYLPTPDVQRAAFLLADAHVTGEFACNVLGYHALWYPESTGSRRRADTVTKGEHILQNGECIGEAFGEVSSTEFVIRARSDEVGVELNGEHGAFRVEGCMLAAWVQATRFIRSRSGWVAPVRPDSGLSLNDNMTVSGVIRGHHITIAPGRCDDAGTFVTEIHDETAGKSARVFSSCAVSSFVQALWVVDFRYGDVRERILAQWLALEAESET